MPTVTGFAAHVPNQQEQTLSSVSKEIARFWAPNAVENLQGLLQIQFTTQNTSGLKVEITVNTKLVISYGPSDTNMTRMFQGIILANTIDKDNWNIVAGRVVAGSGSFTALSVVMWWQAPDN